MIVIFVKKRVVFNALIYIFIVAFVHNLDIKVISKSFSDIKQDNTYQVNRIDTVKASTIAKTNNDNNKLKTELKENSDFVGNLYIENENFVSSIVQTTDNSFYLNHNINKEKSHFGAPFWIIEQNLVIKN